MPIAAALIASAAPPADPFAFFRPTVVVTADEWRQLERGEPMARTVPTRDREVAVFAVVPVRADGDRLVAWMRRIVELKQSTYVLAIGRFSDPPQLEDVAGLALLDDDLEAIRRCRPGACEVKLTAPEMRTLRGAADAAGGAWKAAVQDAFRRIVVERVQAYLAGGHPMLAPYADSGTRVSLAEKFARLVQHSRFLTDHAPALADYLVRYPAAPEPDVESFVYWSQERLAARPIVTATHVSILRGTGDDGPEVVVAGKAVFATHYMDGSLAVTAIVRGGPTSRTYLAYLNRSDVDVLGGPFGGLARWMMQRRLKADASVVLQGLARRLESGEPTGTGREDP